MKNAWIGSARYASVVLLLSALLISPGPSSAQPVDVPPTWGGDFWDRPRLTGSWWGLRDELGKKGVVFDVDALLTPQGVLSGGKDTGWEFWGNAEYTLHIDTGKLGLWPGGFFKIQGNTGFGDTILGNSGALVPVNTAALIPKTSTNTSGLVDASFTQFLSTKFALTGGKLGLVDGSQGEFSGNYRTQFMNTALAFPMALLMVPLSAYGGGVIVLPWDNVVLSALAIDPSGTPTNNDISEAFDDGAMVLVTGQVTIKPFGLLGHQAVSGMWSDKSHVSLIQDPNNIARFVAQSAFPRLQNPGPILTRILERFFPNLLGPVKPANREDTTWAVSYGFDQYFWHPGGDQKRGIGMFFTFGASDGDANPVKYSYAVGIGGNGVVPGRPRDTFGVGWARTQFSNNFLPLLRQRLNLGLDHEDAVEMYYNAAITPWLGMSLDLQVVNPGLQKMLNSSNNLQNVDTAVVGGVRMYIRF
jgi:porin